MCTELLNGCYRVVEIIDDDYVIKRPAAIYDDNGYAVDKTPGLDCCSSPEECLMCNINELKIYREFGADFSCLCPIDLDLSTKNEVYMRKVDITAADILYCRCSSKTESLISSNIGYSNDLVKTLAALIDQEWIDICGAIEFMRQVERLDDQIKYFSDDLHAGNIGVLNNMPVIIDYGLTEVY